MFLIFRCRKCGRFLSSKAGQKTRRCPQCGKLIRLNKEKLRIYAQTPSSLKAIELIRAYQEKIF
ncbi:MAG: DUF1922 domain-containing protein [Candidatus Thermoplasmatota archaeon]|nr:DUF1922 domain-containing protein [Candidatus Thermoplasmatota archaeon]